MKQMKPRLAFNFYGSYREILDQLDDKQKVLFMTALLDVQFLEIHIDKIVFKDKMLSLAWKSIRHSVIKQLDGYCNSKSTVYNSLFDEVSDASGGAYEGTSVQEEVKVQGKVKEKDKCFNAPLRFATISLTAKADNKTHLPRQVITDLDAKYQEELDNQATIDVVIKFIEYRDDMYASTKDKKYALRTIRPIVGFLNEISEVSDYERAFYLMESNEWATFKREWTKEKI